MNALPNDTLENPSICFSFFPGTLNRVLDMYQTSPSLLIKFISLPQRVKKSNGILLQICEGAIGYGKVSYREIVNPRKIDPYRRAHEAKAIAEWLTYTYEKLVAQGPQSSIFISKNRLTNLVVFVALF